eukprot:gene948-678_t
MPKSKECDIEDLLEVLTAMNKEQKSSSSTRGSGSSGGASSSSCGVSESQDEDWLGIGAMPKKKPGFDKTPEKQGAYDPRFETENCGVGVIADIHMRPTRKTIDQAIDMLICMTHRGAHSADPNDGDGAGILMSIPDEFFRTVVDFQLPPEGQYGVGNIFLPVQTERRQDCVALIEKICDRLALEVLGWRMPLETDNSTLGKSGTATEPVIGQLFVAEAGTTGPGVLILKEMSKSAAIFPEQRTETSQSQATIVEEEQQDSDRSPQELTPRQEGTPGFRNKRDDRSFATLGSGTGSSTLRSPEFDLARPRRLSSPSNGPVKISKRHSQIGLRRRRKDGSGKIGPIKVSPSENLESTPANKHRRQPLRKKDLISEKVIKLPLETRCFLLRRLASQRASEAFICSLSSRTIVYKGQFKPDQLFSYYKDFDSEHMKAWFIMVHSRFSTNSFPAWHRAQPFRCLTHNGEINTFEGNRNLLKAREALMKDEDTFGFPVDRLFPIDEDIGSDTALVDNIVELLTAAGRDIVEVMMMIVPEPWQHNQHMDADRRAFYQFLSCGIEPWDGPALLCFTDGKKFGATVDRNGLRPGRFYETNDGYFIVASEVGVVDVPDEKVVHKGMLQPGQFVMVDFENQKLVYDKDIKQEFISRHPYQNWICNMIYIKDILEEDPDDDQEMLHDLLNFDDDQLIDMHDFHEDLAKQLILAGFNKETLEVLAFPMADTGHEPLGSMGADTPLAALSNMPRNINDYVYQTFAQGTNPPIDALREGTSFSLQCPIGPEGNLLHMSPESCRRIMLDEPVLDTGRFLAITNLHQFPCSILDMTCSLDDANTRKTRHMLGQMGGINAIEERIDQICMEAESAINDGASVIVLSHRRAGEGHAPIDSALACGALHHYLVKLQ